MQNYMSYVVEYGRPNRPSDESEWKRSDTYHLIDRYLKVQYENSLRLGWDAKDIILVTNFSYRYKKMEALQIVEHSDFCLDFPRFHALEKLYSEGVFKDKVWLHDLDCFQLIPFEFPPHVSQIGICKYAVLDYLNIGSMFFTKESVPVLRSLLHYWSGISEPYGEKALHRFIDNYPSYRKSLAILNHTYNLNHLDGQYHFRKKYKTAVKPILAAHFHPDDIGNWRVFCEGYMNKGQSVIDGRLRSLLIEYGFRRYADPKMFLVRPQSSIEITVRSFYLRNALIHNKAGLYVTEQNGEPVLKIWRIWDKRLAQRLKQVLEKKVATRLRVERKGFNPSSINIEPI
ncbi:MAG: hypothetical protein ISS26_04350 [Candidatus Omnitrophica bacterium]|nr:hypothetical protein [Candidatus Omnitrophota bacterium]